MSRPKIGFAFTGSFCTFRTVIDELKLISPFYDLTPIFSYHAAALDTRFGNAKSFIEEVEQICGRPALKTIPETEPIGPDEMFDLVAVVPCTGNTLAKLANSITDTPVTMAVKSHLRGQKPVLLAVSTNDALSGGAKNFGILLNTKHYFFVPMVQDSPEKKPSSLVSRFDLLAEAIEAALERKQLQPIFR
jgi:dipicolinate synthase subunit B